MDQITSVPSPALFAALGSLLAIACSAFAEQLAGAAALVFRDRDITPGGWRVAGFVVGAALVAAPNPIAWMWVAIAMAAAWTAGRIAPLPDPLLPVRDAVGVAAGAVVLAAAAVYEWPVVRQHAAGAVVGTLIATVAIRRPWRYISSRRLLAAGAGLGVLAAHEAWGRADIPSLGWHAPVFGALAVAVAGCLASGSARAALMEATGLATPTAGAAARVSRIAAPSALAGGLAGMVAVPVAEARLLGLGAVAVAAEFGRRRMAPLETMVAKTTLGGASSALTGFLLGWLTLVTFVSPVYATDFGYTVRPNDVIGPDDWVLLASAVGASVGFIAGFVFEVRRIPRGRTATCGLGLMAIGSIAGILGSSFGLVALSYVLAAAGVTAAVSVIPNEVRERIRDVEGGAADDALLIVAFAAAAFLGGVAAHVSLPSVASIVTAAVAVSAWWAFRPVLRSSSPPDPVPGLRDLLKQMLTDRHLMGLVAVLGLNYTVLVPIETKAVAVFSQWGWSKLAVAAVLAGSVLPSAVVAQLGWSRFVRRDHLKAGAIAGMLSLGTLVLWTIGLLLGQPTATLVLVMPAAEICTTLTFIAVMQALLGERGNVPQWSFANTARWGLIRTVFIFIAAAAFTRGPGTVEWRLVAVSAPPTLVAALIAWWMYRTAGRSRRPALALPAAT